jgi:hypothetical protein
VYTYSEKTRRSRDQVQGRFQNPPRRLLQGQDHHHFILVSDQHSILTQALLIQDIRDALDNALTGCSVTLSCIDNEIGSHTTKLNIEEKLNFADRAKVVWKDNKFKELL